MSAFSDEENQHWTPKAFPVVIGIMALSFVVALGAFLLDNVAMVKPTAERARCQANLGTLYKALVQYVSLHNDVPRGRDGNVSIDPLSNPKIQKDVGIDSSTLRCPADNNATGSSYVLNPAMSVHDLRRDSTTVIACDRLPNHLGEGTHNGRAVVLIGDGTTVMMDLPLKEQEDWRRLFLSGDKRAGSVSMKDGSKGNWTSSGVIWYVGSENGYVPNE